MPKRKNGLLQAHFKQAIIILGGADRADIFVNDIAHIAQEIDATRAQISTDNESLNSTTDPRYRELLEKSITELEKKTNALGSKLDFAEATLRAVSQSVNIESAEFNKRVKQAFDALTCNESAKAIVKESLNEYALDADPESPEQVTE